MILTIIDSDSDNECEDQTLQLKGRLDHHKGVGETLEWAVVIAFKEKYKNILNMLVWVLVSACDVSV